MIRMIQRIDTEEPPFVSRCRITNAEAPQTVTREP
jgi:hypothetical protein